MMTLVVMLIVLGINDTILISVIIWLVAIHLLFLVPILMTAHNDDDDEEEEDDEEDEERCEDDGSDNGNNDDSGDDRQAMARCCSLPLF